MIVPRSVATQGLGFGPLATATQGFFAGAYVQLGGFGQVVAFGLPTIGNGSAPLLVEVPSLATLLRFGAPTVGGGGSRPERLFVRATTALWRVIQRGVWHRFSTPCGVIFEEVSTTHVPGDSYYEHKSINATPLDRRKTRVEHWGRYQIHFQEAAGAGATEDAVS